jgi:two-component system CheB/CheR fusion protein
MLFRELLIGVTSFFRDPQAFESLQEQVIRRLLAGTPGRRVRVWVPGCSTGEEAYSLAILFRESLDEVKQHFQVQVFATDLDVEAVEVARAGIYPDSIAADVSSERLGRFFTQENNTYRVNKTIRDLVVFAKQDVLRDPPFSRIDLISCRNLLIYLSGDAQKKVLPLFHYALNQGGYLFLGNSETVGESMDLFAGVDRKWKVFRRQDVAASRVAITTHVPLPVAEGAAGRGRAGSAGGAASPGGVRDLAQQVLLEEYVPASVLINAEFDVLYIHGRTGKYLELAEGGASLNLLHMTREGLRLELAAAVRRAITQQARVRFDGLQVKTNGDLSVLNLIVQPVTKPDAARGLLMVIFEEVSPAARPAAEAGSVPISDQEQRLVDLERELGTKSEYLQTTIEELETTNEELKSTNEELQSSNEELQSTNEELETSKEELQSVNEELTTVNTELQKKIDELSRANNDMNNLLAGTNIGTLFLDYQLRIQRFTPATTRIISLIKTDIGRPVSDIVPRFKGYDRLVPDVRAVLDTLIPKETDVQTQDGQWYQMRIQPYRTLENVIEGAVITFVEVTEQKAAQWALRESEDTLKALFELLPVGVAALDAEGRVVYANPTWASIVEVTHAGLLRGEYVQRAFLKPDGTPMPDEESAGMRAVQEQRVVEHIETGVMKAEGGVIWTDMSAVPVALPGWRVIMVAADRAARRGAEETPPKPDL